MFVRSYLVNLILGCCLGGLALVAWLEYLHRGVERSANSVSSDALALRDLERFEEAFGQWLLLSDLVLGSDETYLGAGAMQLSESLSELLERLEEAVESLQGKAEIRTIGSFLVSQRNRLQKALNIGAIDREPQLAALLDEMDHQAGPALEATDRLRSVMEHTSQQKNDAFADRRDRRLLASLASMIVFFLLIASLWLWISRIVSRPLQELADEAHYALVQQRPFSLAPSGPREVQQLTRAFLDLVENLNDQILAHRKTQEDRERISAELVEASRKAGMAEVASGILHNVGNVLNSVTVSVSMLRDHLKKSHVSRLAMATDVLLAHQSDLPQFFAQSRKGVVFPQMLSDLTDKLVHERRTELDEVAGIAKHIDHIRDVINTQQDLARNRMALEDVNIAELVDEALQINEQALHKSRICVVRNFDDQLTDEQLTVSTEKHKVLQILVNLFNNAIDAMQESEGRQRILSIGIAEREQRLCITVADNGVGITKDDLARIFQHGFTTKVNGHGFGLHSCAVAAQSLGGALSVQSEGEGQGAAFSLSIPYETSVTCNA